MHTFSQRKIDKTKSSRYPWWRASEDRAGNDSRWL